MSAPEHGASEPLARVSALLALVAGARSHADLDAALTAIVASAADVAGFGCVVAVRHVRRESLMRTTASVGTRWGCAQLAWQNPWSAPGGADAWPSREGCRIVTAAQAESAWFPLCDVDGVVVGALGAAGAPAGAAISPRELRALAAVGAMGAHAVRRVEAAIAARRHRDALERLMRLSAAHGADVPLEAVLDEVVTAIRDALGFRRVTIRVHAGSDLHVEVGDAAETFELTERDEVHRFDRSDDLAVCAPLRPADGAPLGVLLAAGHDGPPGGEAEIVQALQLFADNAVAAVLSAAAHREAERLAHTDSLTGLGNRRAFMDHVAPLLEAGSEQGVGLVLCDLDGLKQTNDRDGHAAGDTRLQALATQLRRAALGAQAAFRLGGDEFAVLQVPGGEASVAALASSLDQALAAAGISASIGWAVGTGGCTVDALIEAADAEMYRAKRATAARGPRRRGAV